MRRSLGRMRLLGALVGLAAAPLAVCAATMEIGTTVVNSGADATIPVRVDADTLTVVSSIDEVIGQVQMQAPAPANLDFESLVVDPDWQGTVRFRDSAGVQVDVDYIVDATPGSNIIAPGIGFLPTIERIEFELVRVGGGTTSADDVIMDVTFSSILAPVSVNPMGWTGGFPHEMRGDAGTTEPFSIGPLGGAVAISAPICDYSIGVDDATAIPANLADPTRVTGRSIGPAGGAYGGIILAGNPSCGFAIDFDSPVATFPTPDDNCAAFSPVLAANETPWPTVSPFVTTNADGTVLVADDCTDFIGAGTGSVANLVFNAPPYFGAVTRSAWLRLGNGGANDAWVFLEQTGCSYTDPTTAVNIDCTGGQAADLPASCAGAVDGLLGSFNLVASAGCEWTVTVGNCAGDPAVDWLAVVGGPTFTGTTSVDFTACPNEGPARTGTIRVEDGQGNCYDITVNQESGCNVVGYTPVSETVLGIGETGLSVDVEVTAEGCVPTFSSPDAWVTNISAGPVVDQSGVGTGPFVVTVTYDVAPNAGPARSTTLEADLGLTCFQPAAFPIDQECGCILALAPEITNPAIEAGGGAGNFNVTDEGCTFTVEADQPWVTINTVGGNAWAAPPAAFGPAGSPGVPGDSNVTYTVAPNLGAPRTAIVTVTPVECGAPVTYTICQEGDCVVSVTPNEIVVPSTYTQSSFDILAPAPADVESTYGEYAGPAVAIANGDGVPFTFFPGEPALTSITIPEEGFVLDVKVRLNIEHQRPSDVTVALMHVPTGKIAELVDRPGVSDGNELDFGCDGSFGQDIRLTLGDDGVFPVELLCPLDFGPSPHADTFIPNTPLATFDGIPMRGEWVLIVIDSVDPTAAVPVQPGAGSVIDWAIEIDYQPIGCSWEIVGPAVDGNGDPLNGNGIPNWVKLTNLEPLNANGVQRFIGSGSKHITFDVLPTPSELSRTVDLRVIPFVSAIGGDCAEILFDDSTIMRITQWADCLYTIEPKKTDPCLGAGASSENQFTIQTNQGFGSGSSVVTSGTVQCLDDSGDTQIGLVDLFEVSPLATVTEAAVTVVFEKRSVDTDSNSDGSLCDEVDDGLNIFPNEINLVLESPTGTQIELIPANYFIDQPSPNVGQVTYTFVPGAVALPGAGANLPPSGVYAPPVDDLATLAGENAFGTWNLVSSDNAGTDPLIVSEWTLSLEVEQPLGPLNACTWRLDDITSWVTVTGVSYPDWPSNPPAGDPGHDPNLRVNPVLFGQPGYPATADNFQGEGTAFVTYDVAANPTPSTREGWVEIGTENGLYKHQICQSAEPCVYTVDPPLFSPSAEAGSSSFRLVTGDLCCWRVWENVDWIEITSFPQGQGTDTVEYDYDSNIGPARRSWIYVTDCDDNIVARHEISQEAGCDLQIDSFLSVFPSIGGPDSFNVSIGTGCVWTASTTTPWITVINTGGNGNGIVNFTVAPNVGPARSGSIEVQWNGDIRTHFVQQASGCILSTSTPGPFAVVAGGDVINVEVDGVTVDCPYSAFVNDDPTSNLPYSWIHITGGASSTVADTVEVTVDPNPGPARTGSIRIVGDNNILTIVINQGNGCTLAELLDASGDAAAAFNHEGGSGEFLVTLADNVDGNVGAGEEASCPWTAVSNNPTWITIQEGNNGVGEDSVVFTVAPYYAGGVRNGTITVTGPNNSLVYSISQTDECAPVITATTAAFNHSAQSGSFQLTGMFLTCPWTASIAYTNGSGWLSLQSGQDGTGNGLVTYEVGAYFLAATPATTREAVITVTAQNGLTATHTITQTPDCELLELAPAVANFTHDGGAGFFDVLFTEPGVLDCAWNIQLLDDLGNPLSGPNGSWINVQDTFNGIGDGHVDYEIEPWFDAAKGVAITRTGVIRVILDNGTFLDHVITQVDECTPLFAPANEAAAAFDYNHSAQADEVALVGMDDNCPWTVEVAYDGANTSPDGWVSLQVVGDQTGNATLAWEVSAYFDAATAATPRIATITVTAENGRSAVITLTQLPDCDLTALSPDALAFNHEGGAGEFEVEFAALSTVDCPWRVEVSEAWVNIQSVANGNGNGHIAYDVEPFYFGAAPDFNRTATIRVYLDNGDELTHTVTQVDECTPLATPGSASFNHSEQSGGFVLSGMDLTCPWTATITYNPVPAGNEPEWLSLTTGQEGVGDGLLTYDVAAYFDDPLPATPRSATITITSTNGRTTTHVITQNADCDLTALVDDDGNAAETFNHEGGAGEFNVVFANLSTVDCVWTVTTSAAWVNIQSGIDGIGNGLVSFEVEKFYGVAASRSATITISLPNGDSLVYSIQQNNECVPVAIPTSLAYNHSEQTGSFELTGMFLTCPWEAEIEYTTGEGGWLTISSGNDGTGNQLITYEMGAFFSDPALGQPQPPIPTRTAIIRIISRTRDLIAEHTITQSDDCDLLALVPASKQFYQAGGFGEFQVPFASGGTIDCVFAIAVNATDLVDGTEWISIQTGFDGAGNSIVTYEVEPFFNSCPNEFQRVGTIVLTLPNGDSETHTVTQVDNCDPNVTPEEYVFNSNADCRTFDVFFGNDPNGEYDCHWIARIRYEGEELGEACEACTEVVGVPDPPISEEWVYLMEGSTEGHGDGSVTYCVKDYVNYLLPQRVAYIDIIADNCRVATHRIVQIDPCRFCLTAFDEEADPDCVDLASFTNAEALLNFGYETGIPNDFSVEPPTGTEDDFLNCNVEFWYDHQGRLTGPVVDCNDDNTGTGSFRLEFETVSPFEECSWKATVVEGEQWITIVEGSTGFGNGQVFFEIDPNVVDGPDVARYGVIEVQAANGQTQIVVIHQAEGFYPLDQFELAAPALYDDYGFNANTLVVGYTNLSNPSITTDNAGTSDSFVLFDTKAGRTVYVEPDIETDARGMVVGFADVSVYNSVDKGYSSFLGSFELPVTGRFKYSRTAVREVNSPDNNYNGFTTAKYSNAFTITGVDKLRGTFSAKGAEKFTVVPPELNDFTGFQTATKATSKLDGASAKASGNSVVNNWVPTTASLAISKSSLVGTPALNSYTSDLLLLDSNYNVLGEQNGGATAMKTLFVRERGEKAGNYSWTGQLGRTANNKFTTKGLLQLTFEQVSAEGFWLDRPDTLEELLEILNAPAPGRKNPGAIRGVTVFPTNVSFSNAQVTIRTTEKWNKNLVLNPVVTTPPPTPQP